MGAEVVAESVVVPDGGGEARDPGSGLVQDERNAMTPEEGRGRQTRQPCADDRDGRSFRNVHGFRKTARSRHPFPTHERTVSINVKIPSETGVRRLNRSISHVGARRSTSRLRIE